MTRAVHDRILKDANGDISDHLRNHIHLTNCIHLKNHMHRHSPILADRSLVRDLIVLQRSRSLRDPSTSPPSWHSPSVIDILSKKVERQREGRRLSGSLAPIVGLATSKVAPGELTGGANGVVVASDRSSKSGVRDGSRRIKREESSTKKDHESKGPGHNAVSRNSELREQKMKQRTLQQQLREVPMDSDEVVSSYIPRRARQEEPEAGVRGSCSGMNRVKRRKFRGVRRTRAAVTSRDGGGGGGGGGGRNEMSVASNTLAHGSTGARYQTEEGDEYGDQNVTRAPKNGCGIPWNWSRIHHRGKTFLDIAGRSLSCGLSDSRFKKEGPIPQGRDVSDMPVASDHSGSSNRTDAEALPLLVEASGSQGSTENAAAWVHDYSGELGIFADNLLKQEVDSDLASEARSGDHHAYGGSRHVRHQSLTQKYMPRTFRELVGQNLVAQALANAVVKRKVGLLYVFYGPHGTGKTSCARVFARALNCQSVEHPKPCGFCNSCISQDTSKSRNIREIGPVSNFAFESIMDLLDNMVVSQLALQYRVFIFDDCDTFTPDSWNAISKVLDRAPRRVLFVLVCSSLDVLPHIIISRCQKFFFPKLKDADIIYTLQWIATQENLEIDKDALKLIASRSDGSLRDAEMTLEQLSLLGQRISVPLVQELVGLISDEKLVDLLDLALSADTVNTVKTLREIMEAGVEPLALMSQLATVITDILAGSYDFTKGRFKRKFFRRQELTKEDMEKLRQALKTLSEAEKQLRMSNDRLTWLTAALLQLAPDQQYMLPSSSAETSFNHTPLVLRSTGARDIPRRSNIEHAQMLNTERRLPTNTRIEKPHAGVGTAFQQTASASADVDRGNGRQVAVKRRKGIEEIWLEVLEKIHVIGIREFVHQEGKLVSVSFGAAPTVQLMFSSHSTKCKAEKFKGHILQAFELVLGSPMTIEIRCESRKDLRVGSGLPLILPSSENGLLQTVTKPENDKATVSKDRDISGPGSTLALDTGRSEIVEVEASPRDPKRNVQILERRGSGELNPSQSIVRSKVSLAHVIQQAEGCAQRSAWSKRKAVSIAEKLEQENLRLEPRSRSLLCWKAARVTRRKLSRLKIRPRRPHSIIKLVSCGRCLSVKSPR